MTDPEECDRTILLIDGSHVDRLRSKLGRPLDLVKLRDFFGTESTPAQAFYYRDARDIDEHHRLQRFFDWLERHGIEMRGSKDFAEPWYQRERYGSNLIQLAIDAVDAAHDGAALVIVAGDAKLIPLFKRLEDMDVPVTLVSSRAVPASIAPPPPLIDLAEDFIDINEDERFFLAQD
ncbi:NYN domain-containing protein [Tabrizicola caldifontis]|uniref:NYN domain-containing protein n=1 Tax=Tabrizicola caldifontis TaxID=2528036 RepID=UPI001081DC8A|nr:NYN domain-containing protein [Rhodobacter sp. YIM 73028]